MTTSNLRKNAAQRNGSDNGRIEKSDPYKSQSGDRRPRKKRNNAKRVQDLKDFAMNYYADVLFEHGAIREYEIKDSNGCYIKPHDYLTELHKHDERALNEFGVGLADGLLCGHARDTGFTDDELVAVGLMKPETGADYWHDGLVLFPHFHNGQVSHFSQKDPTGKDDYQAGDAHKHPECVFYNQDALGTAEELILVEGQNDLISLVHKAGECSAVACGGSPSNEQLELLVKHQESISTIYLLFDSDKAGRKHAYKAERYLKKYFTVRDLAPGLGDCKDIDELLCNADDPYEAMQQLLKYRPPALDYRQVLDLFGIDVLGEQDDQAIVLWIRHTGKRWIIKNPAKVDLELMYQMLGQEVTEKHLCTGRECIEPNMYKPTELRHAIAFAANQAPRMSERNIIGQGIWRHRDSFLVINGDQAKVYDGNTFKKVVHPRLGKKLIDFDANKKWTGNLSAAVGKMNCKRARVGTNRLLRMLRQWNWTHKTDPEVVASLVLATFVQACWTWRPLVSLVADSDCGKSTLFGEVLQPIFGDWVLAADRSTEAGLRQAIGHDSGPVLIDEFDQYRQRQQVLELFRTSSRGGKILRGTQNQNGQVFGVKHLAWFAAIESGDLFDQDRNRFIRLELEAPKERGVLDLPGPTELAKLGQDLVAVALWAAPPAVALADRIKCTKVAGVHGRLIESFSVPAAMLAVVRHGRDVATETATGILKGMLDGREALLTQTQGNSMQLLQDIMATNIRVAIKDGEVAHSAERTISQLLDDDKARNAADLEAKGVKLIRHQFSDDDSSRPAQNHSLFLVPDIVREKLLSKTRWGQSRLDQLLRRLPEANWMQQRCGGQRMYGVMLPWPGCLQRLEAQDNLQDSQRCENTED